VVTGYDWNCMLAPHEWTCPPFLLRGYNFTAWSRFNAFFLKTTNGAVR
jgi:hypothetical protein